MDTPGFESLILFVSDLRESRAFLGLPVVFEDDVIVVGGPAGRVVLHRNDRGHDERGTFPAGTGVGGAAVRFAVEDPDQCERQAAQAGLPVLWSAQDTSRGRFVVLADPDGRPVVLARMNRPDAPAPGLRWPAEQAGYLGLGARAREPPVVGSRRRCISHSAHTV